MVLVTETVVLREMVASFLRRRRRVAFDCETTGLNPRQDTLIALQFMQDGGEPVVVDLRRMDVREVGAIVSPLFSGRVCVCGHNLKFDLSFLWVKMGIRARRIFDTFLAEVVLYSADLSVKYGLDKVVARRGVALAFPMNKLDREWFIGLDTRDEWGQPFPEKQIRYMENDVRAVFPIMDQQQEGLRQGGLEATAALEFSVCPVLVKLECDGVPINEAGWRAEIQRHRERARELENEIVAVIGPPILAHYGKEADNRMEEHRTWETAKKEREELLRIKWDYANTDWTKVAGVEPTGDWMERDGRGSAWGKWKLARMREWREENPAPARPKGVGVNVNSQPQLLVALRGLGVKGADDTSDKTLARLESKHSVIGLLRCYRKETKFVAAYGDNLLAERDPTTNRFHFSYNQMVATGRMSASRIQQIPKKGDGTKLREQVCVPPGRSLVTCDYPAIEMRILAEISGEDKLIDIFRNGADIHSEIARDLFDLDPAVDPKREPARGRDGKPLGKTCREIAKTVEYGTVYGIGPKGLAELIGCSVDDARTILADFFDTYRYIASWLKRVKKQAVREFETRTMGGRARFFKLPPKPETAEERKVYREEIGVIERAAGNAPIQGTNADMTKTALVRLYADLERKGWLETVQIVAAVHDEIVLEAPTEIAEEVAGVLAGAMEYGARRFLKMVPVSCRDFDIGPCWHKA